MAGAYATFAASGQRNDPYSVTTVDARRRYGLPAREDAGQGLRAERRGQRHRRPEDRRRQGNGYQRAAARPPGRGQDRYHRRQQVRLVRGLHPAAVDRHHDVPAGRQREQQEARVLGDVRHGWSGEDPRSLVPGRDLARLHDGGAQGRARQVVPHSRAHRRRSSAPPRARASLPRRLLLPRIRQRWNRRPASPPPARRRRPASPAAAGRGTATTTAERRTVAPVGHPRAAQTVA